MTITEYVAILARAFMAAEIAMASVNCGAANVSRASRKAAWQLLCPRRTGDALDRD
jgi:hypothetical protein